MLGSMPAPGHEQQTTPVAQHQTARRLWRDERGAMLLEFTVLLVPFFFLLFAIFEVALLFWASFELENATGDAARLIRTGQVQVGKLDETAFKTQLCSHVVVLVNCTSKVRIDVRSHDDFGAISPPSPLDASGALNNSFTYAPGGPKHVVLVTAFYEWPLLNMLSGMSLSNMANGHRLLRASVAFRNEPFPED